MRFSQTSSRKRSASVQTSGIKSTVICPKENSSKTSINPVSVLNLQSVQRIIDSSIDNYHENRNKIFNKVSFGDIRLDVGDGVRIKSGSLVLLPEFAPDESEVFISNETANDVVVQDKSGLIMDSASFTLRGTALLVKDGSNWVVKSWSSEGSSEFMGFPEAP